jgi:hypothetical protein
MAYKSNLETQKKSDDSNHGGSSRPGGMDFTGPRVLTRNGTMRIFSDKTAYSMEVLGEIQASKFAQELGGKVSIELKSEVLLEGLNFTEAKSDELSPGLSELKNFSLIGSTNKDETIANKKIVDPDLATLTPNKINAQDKFKSETDTFYELDESRTTAVKKISQKAEIARKKKIIKVSRDAARITKKSIHKMTKQPKGKAKKYKRTKEVLEQ